MTFESAVREFRSLPYLTLILVAAGCSANGSAGSKAIVRDSAGVEIVENAGPLWPEGAGWRLSQRPILNLGEIESAPEYQLYRVFDAVRLDDGRVVVANSGANELRFYDSTGSYLGSAGREGGGPGEFEGLRSLTTLAEDSLLTYDWRQRRISVFDSKGAFSRSFTPEPLAGTAAFADQVAPLANGSFLIKAQSIGAGGVMDGLRSDTLSLLLCDGEGALLDTLMTFAGGERLYKTARSGDHISVMVRGRLWSPEPQLAAYSDGYFFGSGDSFEVGYYSSASGLQRLIRLHQPELLVTDQDIERYKREEMEEIDDENDRRRFEEALADMPFTQTFPAYDALLVDSEGNLWLEEYPSPGLEAPSTWKVFDNAGVLLGTVETPYRFRPFQIGPDFVLGRWLDEFDIEHVHLYELLKPELE
ncbi:MAG: hypothetical protein JSU87_11080 [Gemmatimonadota bacterium]|nr:MAG: hypothetical protein JSU87_11080 [Gemmatimonadota bacterium]